MLRLSEEFRYAEVLLDGLEEQLYHPSLFGETCDELHGTLSRCRGPVRVRYLGSQHRRKLHPRGVPGTVPVRTGLSTSASKRALSTASSICPNNVLYMFMSVIPYEICFCVVTKLYHE